MDASLLVEDYSWSAMYKSLVYHLLWNSVRPKMPEIALKHDNLDVQT